MPDFDATRYRGRIETAPALAEHLTGVRLGPELFEGGSFATGTVEEPWD
ncbi:DUF6461 domain-containing protein [Kitasatospora sp. NPDC091335]